MIPFSRIIAPFWCENIKIEEIRYFNKLQECSKLIYKDTVCPYIPGHLQTRISHVLTLIG